MTAKYLLWIRDTSNAFFFVPRKVEFPVFISSVQSTVAIMYISYASLLERGNGGRVQTSQNSQHYQ